MSIIVEFSDGGKEIYDSSKDAQDAILEAHAEGVNVEYVEDENGKPYRYVFKITDYISELLKSEDPLDLVKLGVKGVVLFDSNPEAGEKRVKLEVFYTELNN